MSDEKTGAPDRVQELTIELDATPAQVWEAVSTGEGLSRWFAPEVTVKPGVGGEVTFSFGEGMTWSSNISRWEPGVMWQGSDRFPSSTPGAQGPLLVVEYHVEARAGGKAAMRLVQSGFDNPGGWDDLFDGTEGGWAYFLENLKHALERHPGEDRRVAAAKGKLTGPRAQVWGELFSQALRADRPAAGLKPGDVIRLDLGQGPAPAEVVLHLPGTHLGARLPTLGDGLLMLELVQGEPTRSLGVQISLYGDAAARTGEVQAALSAWEARVFPSEG